MLAARFLTTGARGELIGMDRIATVAVVLSVVVPLVVWRIERRLRVREGEQTLPLAA